LDANAIEPKEVVSANKKLGRKEAAELTSLVSKLVVAKGKKISRFKEGELNSSEALAAMLGPTGNLRAPTLRVGKTLVVGFNDEIYTESLL
jgi:arsenate reductase-like glutaredoxin family protein